MLAKKQIVKIGERYFWRFSPNTGHVQTAWSVAGAALFTYGDIPKTISDLGQVIDVEICLATHQ